MVTGFDSVFHLSPSSQLRIANLQGLDILYKKQNNRNRVDFVRDFALYEISNCEMITRLPIQRTTQLVRLTPRCRSFPPRRKISRKRILVQSASSSGGENPGNRQEEGSWNWNPFAEDKSKQVFYSNSYYFRICLI